jgi:hypothetical protein
MSNSPDNLQYQTLILYNVSGSLIPYDTSCTRFATEDAVRIVNSFYFNPNHT